MMFCALAFDQTHKAKLNINGLMEMAENRADIDTLMESEFPLNDFMLNARLMKWRVPSCHGRGYGRNSLIGGQRTSAGWALLEKLIIFVAGRPTFLDEHYIGSVFQNWMLLCFAWYSFLGGVINIVYRWNQQRRVTLVITPVPKSMKKSQLEQPNANRKRLQTSKVRETKQARVQREYSMSVKETGQMDIVDFKVKPKYLVRKLTWYIFDQDADWLW